MYHFGSADFIRLDSLRAARLEGATRERLLQQAKLLRQPRWQKLTSSIGHLLVRLGSSLLELNRLNRERRRYDWHEGIDAMPGGLWKEYIR